MITEVTVEYKPETCNEPVRPIIEAVYVLVSQTNARAKAVIRTEEVVTGRVILDYAADGDVIGVEVLG